MVGVYIKPKVTKMRAFLFYSHVKFLIYTKGFALILVLKARCFTTQKWSIDRRIILEQHTKNHNIVQNQTDFRSHRDLNSDRWIQSPEC